jgi:AsmA family protein
MERSSWDIHRWRRLAVRTVGVLLGALVLLLLVVLILGQHLRGPIVRYAQALTDRQIRIDGRFEAHLFSLHPRLVAEQVTISNPPWTPPGNTAVIGRVILTFELPCRSGSRAIRRLEMEQVRLFLFRDARGRANWQLREPGTAPSTGPPLIRSLRMPNAQVRLNDQRRQLEFEGTVTAQDVPGAGANPPLRMEGAGQLNGRSANFTLTGDPLATVRPDQPYRFEFHETSSGARLYVRGAVPHPFDFSTLETTFESTGEDLKDMYFLTGIELLDTGRYQLRGKLARNAMHFELTDLRVTSGRSDLTGTVLIEAKLDVPSHVEADLRSERFRVSDLGRRAAGRAPGESADGKRQVLPDTELHLARMRNRDEVITYHAQALEAGRISLLGVAAKVKILDGIVTAAPLSAAVAEGKITGRLKVDTTRREPVADIDIEIAHVRLGAVGRTPDQGPPPLDGLLQARIALEGRGDSIHELASNADGTITAVLPRGTLRSSFAELAGLDLRALGLLASGSQQDTGIRCGVASFAAKDGFLSADRLLMDTEPVLITGEGTINLNEETLDLRLQGQPKKPRLRVRAPLLVRGPLAHPSVSIDPRKPAAQAGGAIALGMLLTPVAAMLAFVDPGLARDSDCAALLAEAGLGGQ